MTTINTIGIEAVGRSFEDFLRPHQPIFLVASDDIPLATDLRVLVDLVRSGGPQPLAIRIPDDHRLLAIWQAAGTVAAVTTYWRHKLAHVDLLVVDSKPEWIRTLGPLPLTHSERDAIEAADRPSLVQIKVRNRVPAIAEILGIIAFMPAWLDAIGC